LEPDVITGRNVRLRAIEREDIPRFVRWLNDREVTQYLLINSPLSKAMEEKWFDHQVEIPPTQGQVFAIETLVNDQWIHIGNCGLHNIEPVNNCAEFGILIGEKEFWNRGLGTEATRLTLKHGFEDLNLNRIFLVVYETNPRAMKAYESAGFVKEGVEREAVYKNGRYIDVYLMSILHSEWKGF
jgi:RimJ/RimL family protein N-acetyltransferase